MFETQEISFSIAFMAGFLSFVSPCVLPLVPGYVSYITGLSVEELADPSKSGNIRWITLKNSLLFILGFSIVFISFGASATLVGNIFLTHQEIIRKIGGVLIIVFGLYLIGALKIPWLMTTKKYQFKNRPAGAVGTILIGVAFAAAWTPCVGPILGAILLYASTADSMLNGIQLLSVYSIGLAVPLLVSALGFNAFLSSIKRLQKYMWVVSLVSGILLIFIGILIFTDSFRIMNAWLTRNGIGWTIGQ